VAPQKKVGLAALVLLVHTRSTQARVSTRLGYSSVDSWTNWPAARPARDSSRAIASSESHNQSGKRRFSLPQTVVRPEDSGQLLAGYLTLGKWHRCLRAWGCSSKWTAQFCKQLHQSYGESHGHQCHLVSCSHPPERLRLSFPDSGQRRSAPHPNSPNRPRTSTALARASTRFALH
jgi:hypothetical protein